MMVLGAVVAAFTISGAPEASAHRTPDYRVNRRHVVDRALRQIGAPYSYGSESPSSGFDCSGLVYWAFKNHAGILPRSSSDQWELRHNARYKRVWKRDRLRRGDLMFFNTSGSGVSHVALYIGHEKMVHAGSSAGRVERDSINMSYYRARYVGAVRVPAFQRPARPG
jgi:cell wall-associated NlpC family hydrolase